MPDSYREAILEGLRLAQQETSIAIKQLEDGVSHLFAAIDAYVNECEGFFDDEIAVELFEIINDYVEKLREKNKPL